VNNRLIYLNSNDGTGWLAFGRGDALQLNSHSSLDEIQSFMDHHQESFLFCCLSYDLKEELAGIKSTNVDGIGFPRAIIWKPEFVVRLQQETIDFVQGENVPESMDVIHQFIEAQSGKSSQTQPIHFSARIDKETYISKVNTIKEYIQQGETYELNFCQEYYAENVVIPFELDTYFKLNSITKAPFSAYVKWDNFRVFCGSPERFIQRKGDRLISQPIKGTARRGETKEEDDALIAQLQHDPKERAENVMIVDLVRNDLSQVAQKGSVEVEELCAVKTVETVHQMYSTVACNVRECLSFSDMLKVTFPMGSMTGAPKKRTMEIIEELEDFQRGLFSGTIGLIEPNGDFDLNVVIRTMIYNQERHYLSCAVGSAITANAIPEKEYEECQVKINRILEGINA
jgi:para-aminobenzoate synthetase component 1